MTEDGQVDKPWDISDGTVGDGVLTTPLRTLRSPHFRDVSWLPPRYPKTPASFAYQATTNGLEVLKGLRSATNSLPMLTLRLAQQWQLYERVGELCGGSVAEQHHALTRMGGAGQGEAAEEGEAREGDSSS